MITHSWNLLNHLICAIVEENNFKFPIRFQHHPFSAIVPLMETFILHYLHLLIDFPQIIKHLHITI